MRDPVLILRCKLMRRDERLAKHVCHIPHSTADLEFCKLVRDLIHLPQGEGLAEMLE